LGTGGALARQADPACRGVVLFVDPYVTPAEPFPRRGSSDAARSSDTPLFNAIADSWAAHGRTVPGTPDPEWDRLVAARPGPRRRRLLVPNPRQTGP
jgi:hypothetical protein